MWLGFDDRQQLPRSVPYVWIGICTLYALCCIDLENFFLATYWAIKAGFLCTPPFSGSLLSLLNLLHSSSPTVLPTLGPAFSIPLSLSSLSAAPSTSCDCQLLLFSSEANPLWHLRATKWLKWDKGKEGLRWVWDIFSLSHDTVDYTSFQVSAADFTNCVDVLVTKVILVS